jgi:hypothetical protein
MAERYDHLPIPVRRRIACVNGWVMKGFSRWRRRYTATRRTNTEGEES